MYSCVSLSLSVYVCVYYRANKMSKWAKHLLHKLGDRSLIPQGLGSKEKTSSPKWSSYFHKFTKLT